MHAWLRSPPSISSKLILACFVCLVCFECCRAKVMTNCVAVESKAFVLGLKQEVAQADVSGEEEVLNPAYCISSRSHASLPHG